MYQNNETALTEAPTQPENKVAIYMVDEDESRIIVKFNSDVDAIMYKMQHPNAKVYEHTAGEIITIFHDKPIQIIQEWIKSTLKYKRAYHSRTTSYSRKVISSHWDRKDTFIYVTSEYYPQGDGISIFQSEENWGDTDFFIETKNLDLAVLMCKEFDGHIMLSTKSAIPSWK